MAPVGAHALGDGQGGEVTVPFTCAPHSSRSNQKLHTVNEDERKHVGELLETVGMKAPRFITLYRNISYKNPIQPSVCVDCYCFQNALQLKN
jgi:hypothetical protein